MLIDIYMSLQPMKDSMITLTSGSIFLPRSDKKKKKKRLASRGNHSYGQEKVVNNRLVSDLMIKIQNQEICFPCDLKFKSYDY